MECEPKNVKRYKSPIILTEKGKKAGKEIAEKINCVLDEISTGLTETERLEFYRMLSVISESLEKVCKTGKKIG